MTSGGTPLLTLLVSLHEPSTLNCPKCEVISRVTTLITLLMTLHEPPSARNPTP